MNKILKNFRERNDFTFNNLISDLYFKIKDLENTMEYTTEDDFFGRGWDHAKDEIIKILMETKNE